MVVGAPIATTNKKREIQRVRELLKRLAETNSDSTTSIEQASDQAISVILDLAIRDPRTAEDLKAMETDGIIARIFKIFGK